MLLRVFLFGLYCCHLPVEWSRLLKLRLGKTVKLFILLAAVFIVACQKQSKSSTTELPQEAASSITEIQVLAVDSFLVQGVMTNSRQRITDLVDSLVEANVIPKKVVIKLLIDDAVPFFHTKEVKNILRRYSSQIVVWYPDRLGGVYVKLPPLSNGQLDISKLRQRNVLYVDVHRNGEMVLNKNGAPFLSLDSLSERVRTFLVSDTSDQTLPQLSLQNIPGYGEELVASRSIIALTGNDSVTYNRYTEIYDRISEVYNDLYTEKSLQRYGLLFEELSDERKLAVRSIYPFVLSEIEN